MSEKLLLLFVCFFIVPYRQKVKPATEQRARALIPPFLLFRQLRWREIARRRRGETNVIYEAARRRSSTCGSNQSLGVDKKNMSSGKLFFKAHSLTKKKGTGRELI